MATRHSTEENELCLTADDDKLQAEIDAIPSTMPGLKRLKIVNMWETVQSFELAVPMPNLRELTLEGCNFKTITLTPNLTPNLEHLSMRGCIDPDSNVTVNLPNLRCLDLTECGCLGKDGEWIHQILANANKLRTFYADRAQPGRKMVLASNELEIFHIDVAPRLTDLTLYAPRLLELELIDCENLCRLNLLDSYPGLKAPLKTTRFEVHIIRGITALSPSIKWGLLANPRVKVDDDGEWPDDWFWY